MRTAIVLNGFLRTWDKTKQNFIDTFSHLDADIFISTYDQQYGYHPYIADTFNAHEEKVLSVEEIHKMFEGLNVKGIIVESGEQADKMVEDDLLRCKEPMRVKNCYGQSRKLKIISDYVRQYEKDNNFKYDCIIKTRPDLLYKPDINFNINPQDILIDSGNTFPNDWFFMVNREDYYYIVDFLYYEFFNHTVANSSEAMPHRLHKNAFESRNMNIIIRKIVGCILRLSADSNHYGDKTAYHEYGGLLS